MHYQRWRKYGDPLLGDAKRVATTACSKCGENPRTKYTSWCRPCVNADQNRRRKESPKAKQRHKAQVADYRKRLRQRAILFLGSRCVGCGCSDTRLLEIDHIDGDGHLERAAGKRGNMHTLRRVIKGLPGYQLLCANCHTLKTWHVPTPATMPQLPLDWTGYGF